MIIDIRTTGFNADSKIISIQLKDYDFSRSWFVWDFSDEEKMLYDFVDYFTKSQKKIFVGYNILKFQLPLILIKTSGHEKFSEFFQRINSANIIDLFVILTYLNQGIINTLEFYCKKYEIKHKTVDHDEIMKLFEKKEYKKLEKMLNENIYAIEELSRKVWESVDRDLG